MTSRYTTDTTLIRYHHHAYIKIVRVVGFNLSKFVYEYHNLQSLNKISTEHMRTFTWYTHFLSVNRTVVFDNHNVQIFRKLDFRVCLRIFLFMDLCRFFFYMVVFVLRLIAVEMCKCFFFLRDFIHVVTRQTTKVCSSINLASNDQLVQGWIYIEENIFMNRKKEYERKCS